MRIRTAGAHDIDGCIRLLVALPDHFTAATHDQLRASFAASHVVVMDDDGSVVGFAMAERRHRAAAEITCAAVHPTRHREGICSAIVRQVLTDLAARDVALVEVKTLDAAAGYEPYVATRLFWEHHGFIQVDCIDPLPGWEAGNPCAIYIRALIPADASVDR